MDRATERAFKAAVRQEVAAKLGGEEAGPERVKELISIAVEAIAFDFGVALSPAESIALSNALIDDFLYYGPLQPLLNDGSITEIMVNGGGVDVTDPALPFLPPIVYVERAGRLEYRPDVAFDDSCLLYTSAPDGKPSGRRARGWSRGACGSASAG